MIKKAAAINIPCHPGFVLLCDSPMISFIFTSEVPILIFYRITCQETKKKAWRLIV
jgi:hypothetical protein